MIAGGVTFQPGAPDDRNRINPNAPNGTQEGVQEAIKVLSLRLPKVVGAQASVPTPLLTSGGSEGSPRAHSAVQQVMQKFFPTAPAPSGAAPSIPGGNTPSMPQMGAQPAMPARRIDPSAQDNPWVRIPHIIADLPMSFGVTSYPTGTPSPEPSLGSPIGFPGATERAPDLRKQLDWLPQPEPPQRDETPLI